MPAACSRAGTQSPRMQKQEGRHRWRPSALELLPRRPHQFVSRRVAILSAMSRKAACSSTEVVAS